MRRICAIALALVCTHVAARTEVGVVVELPVHYEQSFTFADQDNLPGDAATAIAEALGKRLGYLTFRADGTAMTRLRFRLDKADDVGRGQHEYGFHVTLENDSATSDAEYLLFLGADRYGDSLGSAAAFVAEMRDVVFASGNARRLMRKLLSRVSFTDKVTYDGEAPGWLVAHSPTELCMSRESSLRFLNSFKQGEHSRESLADAHVEYYDGQILGVAAGGASPFPPGVDPAGIKVHRARVIDYTRDCDGPVEVSAADVGF